MRYLLSRSQIQIHILKMISYLAEIERLRPKSLGLKKLVTTYRQGAEAAVEGTAVPAENVFVDPEVKKDQEGDPGLDLEISEEDQDLGLEIIAVDQDLGKDKERGEEPEAGVLVIADEHGEETMEMRGRKWTGGLWAMVKSSLTRSRTG